MTNKFGTMEADEVSFDDLLEKVGPFGKLQKYYFIFALYIAAFGNIEPLWLNFTAYNTPHFCKANELQNLSFEEQKYIAIPMNEDGEYEECEIFNINFTDYTFEELEKWNRSDMNVTFSKENCHEWVYDNLYVGSTMIDQFDWVCDNRNMGELAASVSMIGFLVTCLFSGTVMDAYGRKKAWITAFILKFLGNTIANCFINPYAFFIGRFISAIGGFLLYAVTYLINTEMAGSKYRPMIALGMGVAYSVGCMSIPLIAFISHNWIIFQWINFGLFIPMITFLFILKESPRWLQMKGRVSEYKETMKYVAEKNKRNVSEFIEAAKIKTESKGPTSSVLQIFAARKTCIYSIVLFIMWFSCTLVFYAINFNVGILVGNIYLNANLVGLVEIPGNFLFMFMLNQPKFGRKYTHMIFYVVTGVSNLATLPFFFTNPDSYFITIMSLVGKGAITGAFNGLYVYTAELYPTQFRGTGFMMCNAVCRIGGIIAPYFGESMQELWTPLPTLLFGVLCTLTGFIVMVLPETLNKALPEILDDIEYENNFYYKNESQEDLIHSF